LWWSFVAQLEAGFDPFSLRLASSPGSEFNNIGVPVNQQTTNGDSSRAGQFYNSVGFAGISSDTYGTLTFFRQNALTLDGVLAYDPMAGSYAFSPIGFSGVVAGGGDTENARYSTSAKYRVNIGDFRVAALWQFGGYELNNASKGAWEGQLGGDIRNLGPGTLSMDAIVDYNRDAVNLSLAGAPTNAEGVPTGTMLPQILTATISNNTSVMALAKYTVDRLKLYAGYEWLHQHRGRLRLLRLQCLRHEHQQYGLQCKRRLQRQSLASFLGRRKVFSYRSGGCGWRLLPLRPEQLRSQRGQSGGLQHFLDQ
jgi:predicted porin